MGLQKKLDEGDIALLEIAEDEVWLGEFLRSTAMGEVNKDLWPPEKWKYRDYQRQLLTDKSQFIVLTGGRAIGKCQPSGARVYTPQGYRKLSELSKEKCCIVYSLTPEMTLEQRRAVCLPDLQSPCFTVVSQSGHQVAATPNHPILTPKGYKYVQDLTTSDYIAVPTYLPWESTQNALRWHELRYLGYVLLQDHFRQKSLFKPRFKKIAAEIEIITDRLIMNWHKNDKGEYTFVRRPGPFRSPVTSLYKELELYNASRFGACTIPKLLMQERLENIKVFLEALFSQFATITASSFQLIVPGKNFALNLQELLLRFGIETKFRSSGKRTGLRDNRETYIVEHLDYRAVYRFWEVFTLPGVSIGKISVPPQAVDATEFMRFEPIRKIYQSHKVTDTFAVYVYQDNNYISDNIFVHNTVVLEDKITYEIVNYDKEFPVTPETVLVTPNRSQMTMPLNHLTDRFTMSKLLREFLKNNVNKSEGTMKFPVYGKPFTFHFRIAGSKGENNMVNRTTCHV